MPAHSARRRPSRRAQRTLPQDERRRAEQDQQRIRARLLRVVVHGGVDDRQRGHPPPTRGEISLPAAYATGMVSAPASAKMGPKPSRADAEDLGPGPYEHVVQGRRRLAGGEMREHAREPPVHEDDRGRLVQPDALDVQGREAERRTEHGEPDHDLGRAKPGQGCDPTIHIGRRPAARAGRGGPARYRGAHLSDYVSRSGRCGDSFGHQLLDGFGVRALRPTGARERPEVLF